MVILLDSAHVNRQNAKRGLVPTGRTGQVIIEEAANGQRITVIYINVTGS